ncbi:unnamed protein product [Gongylonema pulchrum]|uniref:VPS37 C-terminal domain-containing protein n=1 Tax=Gongylonema pulchrum TaxID=637853 RepID=A0A183D7M6_9BILA|nr:unnamed protein product [Gongylonema pulchrum]
MFVKLICAAAFSENIHSGLAQACEQRHKSLHPDSVTFDPQISARSVSLAGSDFNPGGVLTGGSRGNKTALLASLDATLNNIDRLTEIDHRLRDLDERLKALAPIRQQYSELSGQHGQYSRRLQAIHESLKHSAAQILRNEIADIEASQYFKELPQYRETVENGAMERKKLEEKITLLSERKKNEKMFRVEFMLSFLFLLTDQYRFKIQFQVSLACDL